MLRLSKILWAICQLKARPQDLPLRVYMLAAVILAGIIVDSFATSILIPKLSVVDITKAVIIYNLVLLTAVYFLLKLIGYKERGVQTLTAIAGSGLFISLVLLPGLLMMNSVEEQVKSFVLLILIDNVWRIAVNAHIFRHALSVGLLMAMILSVSYLLFGILIADFILPAQNQ
ncbi:MAG: hypothetical protein BMS9Abin31_1176 [Gammaproteobacteria bacterium]|nr:MAG: hypothetical protein BMS9Abin31_1176 [Gammaproteobacteria bacterium]